MRNMLFETEYILIKVTNSKRTFCHVLSILLYPPITYLVVVCDIIEDHAAATTAGGA